MQTKTDLNSAYWIPERNLIPVTGLVPLFPVYERPFSRCGYDIASRRRSERAKSGADMANCPLLTPAMFVWFPRGVAWAVDFGIGGEDDWRFHGYLREFQGEIGRAHV